jgi:hypothetical protein
VVAPDGSIQVAQVDGGNGHSGVRSSELHFGLGELAEGVEVPVKLQWRDRSGANHQSELMLSQGWHNVELGETARSVPNVPLAQT